VDGRRGVLKPRRPVTVAFCTTFQSLWNPNLRIYSVYIAAQVASNLGSWIQITAENWLVVRPSGSDIL
jgi:hypothetical protein